MAVDLSDPILAHLSDYAIGLVRKTDVGTSEVLGSGVLVSIEGRRGILTCGHVAAQYRDLTEIGIVRFVASNNRQRRMVYLGDTFTVILESSDTWTENDLDLAFTMLPPNTASSLEAKSSFLNIERNRTKVETAAPTQGKHVDAILGLVAEFSQTPFVEGREFVSPMRAILHTGHIYDQENGLLRIDAMNYNLDELPDSFGGMSGAGLWRIYFVEEETGPRITSATLQGVASYQINDRKLACQGWDRIDQGLIPTVREKLQI